MPTRIPRPQAEFRQFMIDQFGNDPDGYRVVDIADLVSTSEDPKLAALTTQAVGDMLRAWARHRQIFQGWACKEDRPPGSHTQSKFRIVQRNASAPVVPPVAVAVDPGRTTGMFVPPVAVSNGNGHRTEANGDKQARSRFSGRIQQVRPDGSMLVINDDGAFAVSPVQW